VAGRSSGGGLERGLRFLQARGVQRGVLGTSRVWFWVAVASWGLRQARRLSGGQPEVVYRAELKPGQAVEIDHLTEVYGTSGKRRRFRRR
jgi:hypothetical protein